MKNKINLQYKDKLLVKDRLEYLNKNNKDNKLYNKYLVISLLIDNKSIKEIREKTGYQKSTIYFFKKKISEDINYFTKNKRKNNGKTNGKLEGNRSKIKETLEKTPPHSLSDACSIINNELKIKCSKKSMKKFLDRNKLNYLIKKET